jgi:hypothetical protein
LLGHGSLTYFFTTFVAKNLFHTIPANAFLTDVSSAPVALDKLAHVLHSLAADVARLTFLAVCHRFPSFLQVELVPKGQLDASDRPDRWCYSAGTAGQ